MNQKTVSPGVKRFLYWSPRVLGILFVLFVSLFSLDVFQEDLGVWDTVVAFVMHQVPTAFAMIPLLLAWRWEWMGALVYFGVGAFSIYLGIGEWQLIAFFAMSGPLIVTGILFLLSWRYRDQNSMDIAS